MNNPINVLLDTSAIIDLERLDDFAPCPYRRMNRQVSNAGRRLG